jgi:choline monooxygenase
MNAPPLIRPGLPLDSYVDPAIAAREQAQIFQRAWILVAFESDLAQPNDFVTADLGGVPVVVQNLGGEIQAFRNICSHRRARVQCERHGNRPLTCPYHGWSYGRDGIPTAIPDNKESFGFRDADRAGLALPRVSLARRGAFVFARVAADGPSLEDQLGPENVALLDHLGALFDAPFDRRRLPWAADWKIGVESVLEVYHVDAVHPETFRPFTQRRWEVARDGDHSRGKAYLSDESAAWWENARRRLSLGRSDRFTDYDHWFLWPNVAIGMTDGSLVSVQTYEPAGPQRCDLHFRLSLAKQTREGGSQAVRRAVQQSLSEFNCRVLDEDRVVSETVQANMAHADGPARLGAGEARIADFHDSWRRWMA